MASDTNGKSSKGGMNIDTALVRELAEMLNETGLTEIEVEDDDRRIRVARGGTMMAAPAPMYAAPAAAPAAPAPAAAAPAAAPAAPANDHANAVKSPMVGTCYLAAEPGAAPFISVGQSVKEGDTLLIVEAMKVMNPITSTKSGTVSAILVDNAQPVEFDQPLVVIS
ncbi:acetyl-CoA carboxylase biotin carboxyl carrier protein [Erythrobacter sp. T5W1-R]|uniref:acetyl-CoA carboxylase biotin carboxyl carrier protein n=1 Tax=Erythrobacter sp. T5W1-R TaxID=3101752 RepID=UPI002AFE18E5|nr:acetyl-CoA carboxylase biotin carboxyl carrier protein [Erythrobacter sp. T5W1-R]MEA1619186.1 acetyl-CoA carboxylase biotin carboxyl carrier protein [Erythrobacter sp. T5W1-R]